MTILHGDNTAHFGRFRHPEPIAFFGFSSVRAMADHVARLTDNPLAKEAWDKDRSANPWSGSATMQDAINIARTGWPEGARQARDVLARLDAPRPLQRQRAHGLAGGSVNVGRMLAGNPSHMRQRLNLPGRKIVTIYVEGTFSAGIEPEQIIMRATIIAAACDRLEQRGYSCEIVTVFTVTSDGVDGLNCMHQVALTVKTAGQRLNLDDVVFGIGHPAVFRRFVFGLVECETALQHIWFSQGYPARAFNDDHKPERGEFFVPALQLSDKVDRDNLQEVFRFIIPKNLQLVLDGEAATG